ncbi:MAG: cation:proton antiporter [Terracidiphilus sp.]
MTTLEIASILVATAAVFGWISTRWLKLPITVGTMLLTVIVSMCLTGLGGRFGLYGWAIGLEHRLDLQAIILDGMLPLLLFAGAFLLDLDALAREKLAVSLLSVAGTLISVFLVAGLMFLIAGTRASLLECLIFGALISPTDPIAVLEMLRRTGVPKAIEAQLAGESLFNDGIGAVLFITLLGVAGGRTPTPWLIAATLLLKSGGGIAIGIAAAWATSHLMRRSDSYQVDILLSLALALGGYILALAAHVSGPLEAVAAGIALRSFNRRLPGERISRESVDAFWKVVDEVQNSLLFVLLGLEILAVTLSAATLRAGAAALVSVSAVRFGTVVLLLAIVRWIRPSHRSSAIILTWGGLRGGLSIALALSVPEALGRYWMLGATYLVVVFSIVIQGGSMDLLLRWRKKRWAALH